MSKDMVKEYLDNKRKDINNKHKTKIINKEEFKEKYPNITLENIRKVKQLYNSCYNISSYYNNEKVLNLMNINYKNLGDYRNSLNIGMTGIYAGEVRYGSLGIKLDSDFSPNYMSINLHTTIRGLFKTFCLYENNSDIIYDGKWFEYLNGNVLSDINKLEGLLIEWENYKKIEGKLNQLEKSESILQELDSLEEQEPSWYGYKEK